MSEIPITNLYYILSYALSRFAVSGERTVALTEAKHPLDVLCLILVDESERLLRRGLHQSYKSATNQDGTIRGQIKFAESVRSGAIAKNRIICENDEISADSHLNQIIKSTLLFISSPKLDVQSEIRERARGLASRLPGISSSQLNPIQFRKIKFDSLSKRYSLAIGVCEFIAFSLLPGDQGQRSFVDFTRDDVAMREIFERFIRNFLSHKLPSFSVRKRRFRWKGLRGDATSLSFVPTLNTDVVVANREMNLVVEVKYVPGPTILHMETERLRAAHIYQLYSYLSGFPDEKPVSGLLLYPAMGQTYQASFQLADQSISVHALTLDKSWQELEAQLLGAVLDRFKQTTSSTDPKKTEPILAI